MLSDDEQNDCWFDETGRDVTEREEYVEELMEYWIPRYFENT